MHLAIENRREAIGKKRISIRGPEPNFSQLVVSVNKSLSLLKPPAAVYVFSNVPSIFNTSTSIHLVLIATNKAGDIFSLYACATVNQLTCIWSTLSAPPHQFMLQWLCIPTFQVVPKALALECHWACKQLQFGSNPQPVRGGGEAGESTDKCLGLPGSGGVILRRILCGSLGNPQGEEASFVHQRSQLMDAPVIAVFPSCFIFLLLPS